MNTRVCMQPLAWLLVLGVYARSPAVSGAQVTGFQKIGDGAGGLAGPLVDTDAFGISVAYLGDLGGDGTTEVAVGAWQDDTGGVDRGAVYVLSLNQAGLVVGEVKIDSSSLPVPLDDGDGFAGDMVAIGDLDGDGVTDLAVGATGDDDSFAPGAPLQNERGAVYLLFLKSDGTLKSSTKISDTTPGFQGQLSQGARFGSGLGFLGDLDGNDTSELVVKASNDVAAGEPALYFLSLDSGGAVAAFVKVSGSLPGFGPIPPNTNFGGDLDGLGDVDGDGIGDLAIGANQDDDGCPASCNSGAVYVAFLTIHPIGISSVQKISAATDLAGVIGPGSEFGISVAGLGDLDDNGVPDLLVGAVDDGAVLDEGSVHVLLLESDGSTSAWTRVGDLIGGGPDLQTLDEFGFSSVQIADLDGDQLPELLVGAPGDDGTSSISRGAAWVLFSDCIFPAQEEVRLGVPPNPNVFKPGRTSPPLLGETWDPWVDHGAFLPGTLIDAMLVSPASQNIPLGSLGTLLCALPPSPLVLLATPPANFLAPIPADCALAGVELCTQAASVDPTGVIQLTNALDIVLGTL